MNAIRKLGGYAYYDYQVGADGKIAPRNEPSGRRGYESYLARVFSMRFKSSRCRPAQRSLTLRLRASRS